MTSAGLKSRFDLVEQLLSQRPQTPRPLGEELNLRTSTLCADVRFPQLDKVTSALCVLTQISTGCLPTSDWRYRSQRGDPIKARSAI